MKNREVAAILNELADSMELLGEDRYRVANYRDAATRIEHHHEPIEVMADENRVQQLHGVGKSIGAKVIEYLTTGKLAVLEERRPRVPLAVALPAAEEVIRQLQHTCPTVESILPAGSIRRWKDTIGDIDILVASTQPAEIMHAFTSLPLVRQVLGVGDTRSSIVTV